MNQELTIQEWDLILGGLHLLSNSTQYSANRQHEAQILIRKIHTEQK